MLTVLIALVLVPATGVVLQWRGGRVGRGTDLPWLDGVAPVAAMAAVGLTLLALALVDLWPTSPGMRPASG